MERYVRTIEGPHGHTRVFVVVRRGTPIPVVAEAPRIPEPFGDYFARAAWYNQPSHMIPRAEH